MMPPRTPCVEPFIGEGRIAAALLPARVSTCTLWRWRAKGVYVRNINEIVRLQHGYFGRHMLTTKLWRNSPTA